VQAIERTNSVSTMQQQQRPDTRLLAMSQPDWMKPATETSTQRVGALLPAKNIAPRFSPLLPARSWS
jgi:hypothetical protein